MKLLLLLLLYLFFFRVLQAVWAEVKGPPPATEAPTRKPRARRDRRSRPRTKAPRLVAVEPSGIRDRAYDLGEEVTLGRAAGCGVTVDDTYVSQLHARVFQRDGEVMVEDLGSTNGTYLNRRRLMGPMIMKRGDRLQLGDTVLELR